MTGEGHVYVVADGTVTLMRAADGLEETVVDALSAAVLARAPTVSHREHVL